MIDYRTAVGRSGGAPRRSDLLVSRTGMPGT